MNINFNQPLSPSFSKTNPFNLIGNIFLIVSVGAFVFSAFTITRNLLKLRRPSVDTSASQLLNQAKIQEAISILQEQTIQFIPEQ